MKPFLLVFIAIICSRSLSAQTHSRYEEYLKQLNLTAEQTPKVRSIDSTFKAQVKPLKNSSESKLSKYQKLKSYRNERDKQMKAVLTKEQFKTYKELQKEMKANRKNRVEP